VKEKGGDAIGRKTHHPFSGLGRRPKTTVESAGELLKGERERARARGGGRGGDLSCLVTFEEGRRRREIGHALIAARKNWTNDQPWNPEKNDRKRNTANQR